MEASQIPSRTSEGAISSIDLAPRKSAGDYWAERGEHSRWLRIHVEPRTDKFDPWRAPRGPGRKTRLKSMRRTQGTFDDGKSFNTEDEWQMEKGEQGMLNEERSVWTGNTIFIVDRKYSKEYGTDQRRQRNTVANLSNALV